MKFLLAFLFAGALFGAGLAVSGMTNPAKITGFLDFAGAWDPSLLVVMAGALAVYAPLAARIPRRPTPFFGGSFPARPTLSPPSPRTLAGSAAFGLGWGLAGFCPGPAITNLAALRPEALVFVAAMTAGVLVAQRSLGADGPV